MYREGASLGRRRFFRIEPGTGVNDVTDNLHTAGHESEYPLAGRLRGWRDDFSDRFAEPRDAHGASGLSHLLENGQAGGFELRDRHLFHGPTLTWSTQFR